MTTRAGYANVSYGSATIPVDTLPGGKDVRSASIPDSVTSIGINSFLLFTARGSDLCYTFFIGSNVFVFNDLAEAKTSESLIVIKESIFQGNNLS